MRKLPFTTAKDLSEHPGKFLLTSQSEVSRVISGATSGTTGPAKRVFYTETDTEHAIGLFTAGISEMLTAGEKCCIAFPFTGPFGLGDLIAKAVKRLGGMEELEKALGSRLYPHYGSRECGLGGAVTCPAFEGMHLRENHIIPEIIDAAGNVLPDGACGELVMTTIGADAMPLIRYRTEIQKPLPQISRQGLKSLRSS